MKQEIIELMQKELVDKKLCINDFELYKKSLDGYEGPFIWLYREYGTCIMKLGAELFRKFERQNFRLAAFRDIRFTMASVLYYAEYYEEAKIFFYDGETLRKSSVEELECFCRTVMGSYVEYLKEKYPEEFAVCNKRIPIKLNCSISYLKECLKKAEELRDSSLLNCLKQKRNYTRYAVNQWVEIGRDFAPHSLTFCEVSEVDGDLVYGLNGGIIFSKYAQENRWSSHT